MVISIDAGQKSQYNSMWEEQLVKIIGVFQWLRELEKKKNIEYQWNQNCFFEKINKNPSTYNQDNQEK